MDNYLEHHGILGQKWGVRRYQNSDGSLTFEGKKHYGSGETEGTKKLKAEGEPRRKQLTDEQKAKVNKALKIGAITAGSALAVYGAYKVGSNNPKVASAIAKGKSVITKEAAEYKKIAKETSKNMYKGFKDGIPEQGYQTGKTVGKVLAGGVTWMAAVKVGDLATNGAFTNTILSAYNDHQKKDNKVKTSYRNKNKHDDDD